ncbi:ANTAR domain-containing protein [Microlunatus sagamiharensis]|uniref:ANTAR domain-containing protein n=1 Tax=Microlunatus sagamiharensis TaxID=546874 RepID=A0A1H2MF45_9ACTN|nr:GAF and ANTAR domain-containing protein [Microlunatus sagamiharensis]SDU91877.1 ANTAR domain-containing protein [Microlunatus sagamiharensis]
MADDAREARVLSAVVTLVDNLLQDFDVVELLTDLTEQCATLLDVSSAGLLLADARGGLHLMAATSDHTEEIELLQLQADEGPCLDCYASGRPVSIADLSAVSGRWPQFVPAARSAGFASVHAVPMTAAGSALGALNLFGTRSGSLNESDLLVARSLAHVASVAIVQGHPPTPETVLPRLKSALASHVVVEQAKGFLRERLDVTVTEAFALLRRYARENDTHASAVARRLMSEPASRPTIVDGIRRLTAAV